MWMTTKQSEWKLFRRIYMVFIALRPRYGDGAGNTVEKNSSVFSLILIH